MQIRYTPLLILFLFPLMYGYSQTEREIEVLNFEQLEPRLHMNNDTTYVINFWATWCIPCRKELPYFEQIHLESKDLGKTKVLLVSLDFSSKIESSLLPFLAKNKITAPVVLLSDPNSNSWINKIDPSWSGALPATIIYKGKKKEFFEAELDYDFIKQTIIDINKP